MGALKEIPETVILEMQKRVYSMQDDWKKSVETTKAARKALEAAQDSEGFALHQLHEVLTFLEDHNSDCHEDWFGELGIKRPIEIKS